MSGWTRLQAWSRQTAGLDLTTTQLEALQAYIDLLLTWNRKVSLVSQQDVDDILVKHVADSLFAVAHCSGATRIADLGSGGGFPGVVVAILQPQARVCLLESRGSKASFLEEVCRRLQLANCAVYHGRIEDAGRSPEHAGSYDLAVSRALADIDELRRLAGPLLTVDGKLLAMRAQSNDGDETDLAYSLPDGSPRRLTFLRPRMLHVKRFT